MVGGKRQRETERDREIETDRQRARDTHRGGETRTLENGLAKVEQMRKKISICNDEQ